MRSVATVWLMFCLALMVGCDSNSGDAVPEVGEAVHLSFDRKQTRLYCDSWLVSEPASPAGRKAAS